MSTAAKLETRAALVKRLVELQVANGSLSNAFLETLAPVAGCSVRTLRRDLESGLPDGGSRKPMELNEDEQILYFEMGGCVERVCELLAREGKLRGSVHTYRRAAKRTFDASQRAMAKQGEVGRRNASVYVSRSYEHRNAVWELDHVEFDIEVIPPIGRNPIRPWGTFAIDRDCKIISGLAVSLRPTAADVLVCLRHGISLDERIGPAHGAPDLFVWDGGKEFLSGAVTEVATTLMCAAKPTPAYTPHLKGTIERFNRTVKEEFLATLPYYTGGARDRKGKLYGSANGRLHYSEFVELLLDWVEHYNLKRPHRSLDGRTPGQAWQDDPAIIRTFEEDELRWMTLPSKTVKVGKKGVRLKPHDYLWPNVHSFVGLEVELRYMPHDQRWVDVYYEDAFVARALPSDEWAKDEKNDVLAGRQKSYDESTKLRRAASLRQKSRVINGGTAAKKIRFTSQNGTAPLEPVTVLTKAEAKRELLRSGIPVDADEGLERVNEPWNPSSSGSDLGSQRADG